MGDPNDPKWIEYMKKRRAEMLESASTSSQIINYEKESKLRMDAKPENKMNTIKQEIVEKYGKTPSICYYYYLWNAINYVGEEQVRKSFDSIKNQGDEIIVGDCGSIDGTVEIAKEYGFKVIEVDQSIASLHESKIINAVTKETKCNFLVDASVHIKFSDNTTSIFKNWINNNDITKNFPVIRGLYVEKNGTLDRRESACMMTYKPYLLEARGIDERTWYSFGSSHYLMYLIECVYELKMININIDDMIHANHQLIKTPALKNLFKLSDFGIAHLKTLVLAEALINPLLIDFKNGRKQVVNSYW